MTITRTKHRGGAKPVYLLAGGRRDGHGPYCEVIAAAFAASGSRKPAVACIGAANNDDPDFFDWTSTFLGTAGAGKVALAPLAGHHAHVESARRIVSAADVVFVAGGDVEAGMRILDAAGISDFLGDLHARGTLFIGISAGAIMLAQRWVRWRDPDDDSTAELFDCLGIAPVLCDTHGEGDDWMELKTLLRLCPKGQTGYGIRAGGALRVAPDGTVTPLCEPVDVFTQEGGKSSVVKPGKNC